MRGSICTCVLIGVAVFSAPDSVSAQNIILVIADDVGAEWFRTYGEQAGNPPTPTIDSLAAQGVRFRDAWAYPVCSPYRISVYTGLHPREHGAGSAIVGNDPNLDFVLDPAVPTLASILASAGYRTAAVGKWHMAAEPNVQMFDANVSVTEAHPNLTGMQHYSGYLFGGLTYSSWWKTVNGITTPTTTYATTDTANAAIAALSGAEPFFLWVGFNAPHSVFHTPPAALLANPSIYSSSGISQYRAMIEAMDTELGRFLQHVDWNTTTVIFTSDNGTYGSFLQPPRPQSHGKGTVFQPGVRVPLIVAGQAVAVVSRGRESTALVQATDLFPTILEIAGLTPPPRPDAVSMLPYLMDPETLPQREVVYTELFTPNGGPINPHSHHRAVRGRRYKLVRWGASVEALYDLELDPFERSPLDLGHLTPAQANAFEALARSIESPGPAQVPILPPGALAALAVLLTGAARRGLRRRSR
jgi:arylsulfatase A-like enzyme